MEARCQCGSVAFKTPTKEPLALYICHCLECRRSSGSAFGSNAIFPRFTLPNLELLSCYSRPTPSGDTLYCYFCKVCGNRLVHYTPGKNIVAVKGGCLNGLDWNKAVHIWTKNAMVPIPETCESYPENDNSEYGFYQEALDQPPGPLSAGSTTSPSSSTPLSGGPSSF